MESDTRRPHKLPEQEPRGQDSRRAVERRTEELVQQGQELFRIGRYQQAIHVWTRILFLDRGHLQAREAIERAKRALAERQRGLDAKSVEAARLLDGGERAEARRVLTRLLAVDPRHAEGRALWDRLQALERRGDPAALSAVRSESEESQIPRSRRKAAKTRIDSKARVKASSPVKMATFLFCAFCILGLGAVYLNLNWDFLIDDPTLVSSRSFDARSSGTTEPDHLPTPAELAYYNGARLYAKGQYREALSELARVDRESGFYEEARSLVLRIEERLLRGAIAPDPATVRPGSSKKGE